MTRSRFPPWLGKNVKKLAGLFGVILLLALAVLARDSASQLALVLAERVEALGWIAPIAFIGLLALAIPLFLPAAPFLLVGGILFGPVLGILHGFVGNAVGGAIAFAAARYLVRERVERRLASATGFVVMSEALRREGLRAVALIRFTPALPAWLINYALGVSPVSWPQYWMSTLAILPTTGLYALAGSGLGNLAALQGGSAAPSGAGYYVLLAAGIAATLLASVLLGRRAKRLLEAMNDQPR